MQFFCQENETIQTASLTLCRFDPPLDRLWVFAQMGLARAPLRRTRGLEFFRLMGSGTGEGFTPIPNTAVWSILSVWRDEAAAEAGLSDGVFQRWTKRASESCHILMTPQTARGVWGGVAPFRSEAVQAQGPLAVLTRATVNPSRVMRFWRRVPDISARIGRDPSVLLKIGVGEVPWLHQVTFSIWPDANAVAAFARKGAHADAIRAVRAENWFREELYARFRVTGARGTWGGRALEEVLA